MKRGCGLVLLALTACGQDDGGSEPATATRTQATAPAPEEPGMRPAAFARCATCHQTAPGRNGIGPSLAGVYGAPAAHEPTYAYSRAMRASGLAWDESTLDAYLANPRKVVPGTKMAFAGVRSAEERAAIIEYLKTL